MDSNHPRILIMSWFVSKNIFKENMEKTKISLDKGEIILYSFD